MNLRIAITALLLVGFGPFVCEHAQLNEGVEQIRGGAAEGGLATLDQIEEAAPEIHLARGAGHLQLKNPEEATKALDEAYRLTAVGESELKEGEDQGRFDELRRRIAWARGELALQKEDWDAAQVEFARVLKADPSDEAARWNLELAWHHANPPCPKREDDSEPNDTRNDAKPLSEEGVKDRLLCPGNEDWFAVEVKPQEQGPPPSFWVTLEGKEDHTFAMSDDEHREVTLELYSPSDPRVRRKARLVGGKASVGVTYVRDLGTWLARVSGPGQAEVKYSLRFELVPPCPANDDAEAAKELPQEPVGMKACPGDADWYKLSIPKNEGKVVAVVFDPERAPLEAELYDAEAKSVARARAGKQGLQLTRDPDAADDDAEPRSYLLRVHATEDRENTYSVQIQPDDQGGDDDKQDQQDQDKQDQQDQDKQDQQQQPQPQPQAQVDPDQLIDQLDKQNKNPQLERALRRAVIPRGLEDY